MKIFLHSLALAIRHAVILGSMVSVFTLASLHMASVDFSDSRIVWGIFIGPGLGILVSPPLSSLKFPRDWRWQAPVVRASHTSVYFSTVCFILFLHLRFF